MSYVTSPLRSRNFDFCSRKVTSWVPRTVGGHPQTIRSREGRTLVLNALVGAALCVGVCLIVVRKSNKRLLSHSLRPVPRSRTRLDNHRTAAVSPHTAFLQLTR